MMKTSQEGQGAMIKTRGFFFPLLTAVLLWAGLTHAAPAPQRTIDWDRLDPATVAPGELLVRFDDGGGKNLNAVDAAVRRNAHAAVGAEVVRRYRIPWDHVRLPAGLTAREAAARYVNDPRVAYVEPNYVVHAIDTIPNDPLFGDLWGMRRINGPAAWDIATGETNIVVAVIDTGIRRTHQDLAANMWENPDEIAGNGIDDDGNGYVDDTVGWDFVNNDNDPSDDQGHGTHCAGTIGAVGNNNRGVVGVNWTVRMVALKFLSASGSGSTAGAIAAVEYAAGLSKHIRLTSNSWGGGGYSQALKDAIDASAAVGQLFVAAAGNSAVDNDVFPHYPSSYTSPNIIAVASIAEGGALSGFSQWGQVSVDIGAPGSVILSTEYESDNAYGYKSGTSMATPHVAGGCALVWSLNPALPWGDVRDAILDSAAPNPNLVGRVATAGELDVANALTSLGGTIRLDRDAYRSDAVVGIQVVDGSIPGTTAGVDVAWRTTTNETGAVRASGTVGLTRIADSSRFEGSLALLSGVMAVHGDRLTVTYEPVGTEPVSVSVPIDDVPPAITNFALANVSDEGVDLRWDTDEPSDTRAIVAPAVPLAGKPERTGAPAVAPGDGGLYRHEIEIDGLQNLTPYYAAVLSRDAAGNEATYPVDLSSTDGSDYPSFVTLVRFDRYQDDMESGRQRWTHTGLNDAWEYGEPRYGPPSAASGRRCWGTNLDGLYANMMNAWLVSEPITVSAQPRLNFRHWYDIAGAGGVPGSPLSDHGYVEVNGGSGWVNVTPAGSYNGASAGWQEVAVDLSAFAGATIQVRFRLRSNDDGAVGAGWYIDDVAVSDVIEPGLALVGVVYPVDDAPAYAAANDGDGQPEFGETVKMQLRMINAGATTLTNVTATVDCPSDGGDVAPGTEHVVYGTLAPGELAAGTPPFTLDIAPDAGGSPEVIPLFHTAAAADGTLREDVLELFIGARVALSGVVTNLSGAPIAGAVVRAVHPAHGALSAVTAADGTYLLNRLVEGVEYEVSAALLDEYLPSAPVMVTGMPGATLDFGLGRSYADRTPPRLSVVVPPGGSTSVVLRVANTNALADSDLVFEPLAELDIAWLELSVSPTGTVTVAPGGFVDLDVAVEAGPAPAGVYTGQVHVLNPDLRGFVPAVDHRVETTIEVSGAGTPWLVLFDVDVFDADGDGFVEPGETVEVNPTVENIGTLDATGVTGNLVFTGTAGAAVTAPALAYDTVPAAFLGSSVTPAEIAVDPGAADGQTLPFEAQLTDDAGHAWTLAFELTVARVTSISGNVYTESSAGVPGALVSAVGPGGRRIAAITESDGAYLLPGLEAGLHRVEVEDAPGYPLPPPRQVSVGATDVTGIDFYLSETSLGAGPASFDVTVEEGREARRTLSVTNGSTVAVNVWPDVETREGLPPELPPETASAPPPVDWQALTAEAAAPDTVLVRYRNAAAPAAAGAAVEALGHTVVRRYRLVPAALVRVADGVTLAAAADAIAALPDVAYVEPNYIVHTAAVLDEPRRVPNDPFFDDGILWGLDNSGQEGGTAGADIDAPEAWAITRGDTNIVVAVIDTGMDYTHPDLKNNMWRNPGETGLDTNGLDRATNGVDDDGNGIVDDVYGANFMSTNMWFWYAPGDPMDDHGHGTHVGGTIGAVGNNGEGVVGVNWRVRLMALKFLSMFGSGDTADAVGALEYAIEKGADVVNNSWGSVAYSGLFHDMIQVAQSSNMLVVCAAGNDANNNDGLPFYPAADPAENNIAVAATDRDGLLADFSNYGYNSVDLAAPGVDIWSTVPQLGIGGAYGRFDGTSMASPHVAGVAALVWSLAPEASWQAVKAAILTGTVSDPALQAKMTTGGHLNAFRAVRALQAYWIRFEPRDAVVAGGASATMDVVFNPDGVVRAGVYEGDLFVDAGVAPSNAIPVRLNVLPAPVPEVVSVRVADAATGDGDGRAEPGERVRLVIELRNRGSDLLIAPSAVLSTSDPNVTIHGGASWTGIGSDEAATSSVPAEVTFGPGAGPEAVFAMTVTDGLHAPWTDLAFSVAVRTAYSIVGEVTQAVSGAPAPGAAVQYFGTAAGETVTAADGSYRIDGLQNGRIVVRALADGFARSAWMPVTIAGADTVLDAELGRPAGAAAPAAIDATVLVDGTSAVDLELSNAGTGPWNNDVVLLQGADVALVSDGTQLDHLAPLVRSLGARCTVLNENVVNGYSFIPGILTEYDVVIADLTGENGTGRKIASDEAVVLSDFAATGGKLVLTGRNILGSPDNQWLGEVVGSAGVGRTAAAGAVAATAAATAVTAGPFVELAPGDRVPVTALRYDDVQADTNTDAVAELEVGAAAKVLLRTIGEGRVALWTGNPGGAEWAAPGVLQDLFKNLLAELMGKDPVWLAADAPAVSVAGGGNATLGIAFDAAPEPVDVGTVTGVVLLAGNLPGDRPDLAIPVSLHVITATLQARATDGVADWLGRPLEGSGDAAASLFQLLYAGADGAIDPPQDDGRPTGDDRLLVTEGEQRPFGRFGVGVEAEPDFGRFEETFLVDALPAGARIYARAWDAASFAEAVAYGNSTLYTLERRVDETHDFAGWTVDRVIGYPGGAAGTARDADGDSIPDGWNVKFGFEARRPVVPLTASWTALKTMGGSGEAPGQFDKPGRIAVSERYVFVADTWNDRVQVLDRALNGVVDIFTGVGAGVGTLTRPEGLAFDAARRRLVIADTGNRRIVVLNVAVAPGAFGQLLTVRNAFGTEGTGNGEFLAPYDVATGPLGRVYVADTLDTGTGNHRIQILDIDGNFVHQFGTEGGGTVQFRRPLGLGVDAAGRVYAADTYNNRIHVLSGGGSFLWQYGTFGSGGGQFNLPREVAFGVGGRMIVTDTHNNRVQVFDMSTYGAPAFLAALGAVGGEDGQLRYPQGCAPALDEDVFYVADTRNDRVQRLRVLIDGDGDGMDDTWEELNGLDPTDPGDGMEDDDGDLLLNIGEYRLQTDPQNADSNGNGIGDGQELAAGNDPLAAFAGIRITGVALPPQVLTWTVPTGGVYRVQQATDLTVSNWTDVGGVTAAGAGTATWTNAAPAYPAFYRVVEE